MADELDTQETPEVQETPTSEQVPEQAQFEPRNIGEALEMEPPAPEPTPEPEPGPEAPMVEPSWLNEPAPQYNQQEQQQPQQQQGYPQYDYGYQQQPQVQQGPASDAALNALVEDPVGWFNSQMAAREQQMLGPLQQNLQSIAYVQQQIVEANVKQNLSQADRAIKKAYTIFNKDPVFRSNKEIQDRISGTLQGMRENAIRSARFGEYGPMDALINLDEGAINGTLAFLRAQVGAQSPGTGPLQIEGAAVESSRAPVAEQSVELTPEQEEIARRMGPGYRQKLIKAQKELQQYNDLEWKE